MTILAFRLTSVVVGGILVDAHGGDLWTDVWNNKEMIARSIGRGIKKTAAVTYDLSGAKDCFENGSTVNCAGITPWGRALKILRGADAALDAAKAANRTENAANDGRTLARTCLRSFAGTTLVLMADGTKKPIENVEVGDEVVATDPETGERVTRKVTRLWVHDDQVLDLVVDGDVITTTEDHLFWSVTDQRFERADQLAAGEVVLGDRGRQVIVSGLRLGTARRALAYTLSIAGVHTYHVGTDEIVVHNGCNPFDAARDLKGADPEDVLDAIPDNWIVSTPRNAVGGGIRFSNPANKSEVIIFERGTGLAADGVPGGPYLRLSTGRGPIERIPLLGNPALGGP